MIRYWLNNMRIQQTNVILDRFRPSSLVTDNLKGEHYTISGYEMLL